MQPPKVQLQQTAIAGDRGKKRKTIIPEDRLKEITRHCVTRLQECRTEMGLDYGRENGWSLCPVGRVGTWAWNRQCARMEYANKFMHREALGGVWLESNWSLNVPARFVTLLASKYQDDLVGTDPFFAAMPEKMDDPDKTDLCKQVEKKVQYEVGRSNLGSTLRESIRVALIEGERTIKLTWEVDKTQYIGTDTVLTDKNGSPIKTAKGSYIYQKDFTIDTIVDDKGNFIRALDPQTDIPPGATAPVLPQGQFLMTRLEKEPGFIMPPQPVFQQVSGLVETIEHKNGMRADGMFCEDFIYPIMSAKLSDADIMAHSYDAPLDEINARYRAANYGDKLKAREAAGKKNQFVEDTGPLSTEGQPLLERGEGLREAGTRKLLNIHETYYRCRLNPDDQYDTWLFIVIDFLNQEPIHAEFLGNMNMKRPPFVILRGLESQPGRAYGVGVYEKWHDKSLAVDLCFNRLALKSSKSASATFVHKEAFAEAKNNQPIVLGGREIYTVLNDASSAQHPYGKDHPPIFRVNLAEVDEWTMPLMEKLIQTGQLEFGIVSAADGSSEDLNSSKTATGIRNIERTGNTIQRSTEALQAGDIEEVLDLFTDMTLQNMDEFEEQFIPGENRLSQLSKDEVLDLPRDVRMLLTKAKSQDGIATTQQIIDTIDAFYSKPMSLRKKVRPQYIQLLKDMYVADPDDALDDPSDEEIEQEASAGSGSKASEVIQLKGTDLAQNQKDALLAKDFQLPAAVGNIPGLEGVGGDGTGAPAGAPAPPPQLAPAPSPTGKPKKRSVPVIPLPARPQHQRKAA